MAGEGDWSVALTYGSPAITLLRHSDPDIELVETNTPLDRRRIDSGVFSVHEGQEGSAVIGRSALHVAAGYAVSRGQSAASFALGRASRTVGRCQRQVV